VPWLLQDALTDWIVWFPLLLWLPALIVGGYVAKSLAKERGFRASFVVGAVATVVTLRFVKFRVAFLMLIGLMLIGGLISAAAGLIIKHRDRKRAVPG
jgi:fructose-specific phosphotransferase system IIC component